MKTETPLILHVLDSLGVGGTECMAANVIAGTRTAFSYAVCAIREGGAVAERLRNEGVPVYVLGKSPGNDWTLPLRFAHLCHTLRPQIVHTHNWGTVEAIVGARLARVPVVIHGEHGRHASDVTGSDRKRNLIRWMLAPLTSRVLTVCDYLRDWLVTAVGIPARKVLVIRNGIDVGRFARLADPAQLRLQLGYRGSEFVVGTVGRLDAVKDQASLVEAMPLLLGRTPHARLVIAGDGPEMPRLRGMIEESGLTESVRLLGHWDDIPSLLGALDLFVLPSLGEGLCNTVLEAMAAGLPVVATRVGGNPELIHDGSTGMLFPARNPRALVEAIAFYGQNEGVRVAHGAAGRERVRKHFTVERMLDGYVALYREELTRQRSSAVPASRASTHRS
jgi:sugar transferase (PEP-CTERM/EpsH1 system associated)